MMLLCQCRALVSPTVCNGLPTPCQRRFATVVPMLGRWTKLRRANVTWQRRANTDVVPILGQRQLASWVVDSERKLLKI